MKKIVCILLFLVLALIPLVAFATDVDDLETIKLIEYDCITGIEREIAIEISKSDSMSDLLLSNVNNPSIPTLPNQIIGDDDREEVYLGGYRLFPYSAVGLYSYEKNSSFYMASGFIVAEKVVLTSAHCAYSVETDSWAINGYFLPHAYPNSTRDTVKSNGAKVVKIVFPSAYKTDPIAANDWAILVVNEDIGTSNGIIKLSSTTYASNEVKIKVIGYDNRGVMCISPGYPVSTSSNEVLYTCDTTKCNSGSPVLFTIGYSPNLTYYAYAIHHGAGPGETNVGCRITKYIVEKVSELNNE